MREITQKSIGIVSLITFSILISFPGLHLYAKDKDKGIAKAIILRGNVKAQLSSGKIITLKKGKWVPEGAKVRTGKGSFVKFLFVDKSQMNLGPKSQMEIAEFPEDEAGVINLVKGKLRSKVTKNYMKIKDKDKSKLFIKTKTAAMGVRGTDFRVDYNSGTQQTDLTTFEGRVAMAKIDQTVSDLKQGAQQQLEKAVSSKKAVMVGEGQASSVIPGKDAAPPKNVPDDELKKIESDPSVNTGEEDSGQTSEGPKNPSASTQQPDNSSEETQETDPENKDRVDTEGKTSENKNSESSDEPKHVPPGLDINVVDNEVIEDAEDGEGREPSSYEDPMLAQDEGSGDGSLEEDSTDDEWSDDLDDELAETQEDSTLEKPDYLETSTTVKFLFENQ